MSALILQSLGDLTDIEMFLVSTRKSHLLSFLYWVIYLKFDFFSGDMEVAVGFSTKHVGDGCAQLVFLGSQRYDYFVLCYFISSRYLKCVSNILLCSRLKRDSTPILYSFRGF